MSVKFTKQTDQGVTQVREIIRKWTISDYLIIFVKV